MRLVILMVLAGLVALPLTASAQEVEEGASPEPSAEEPAPSSEPVPEEPALQLKLDATGVDVTPTAPRTFDGYTLEELELRKRRAAFGLIAPAAATVAGVALLVFGTSGDCYNDQLDDWDYRDACRRPRIAGGVLTAVGGTGMIAGSVLAGRRAKEFRRATEATKDYTLEELELGVKRARIGLYTSAGVFAAGVTMGFVAMANHEPCSFLAWECPEYPDWVGPVGWTGFTLAVGGLAGMVASGVLLGKRNREQDRLGQAHYGRPRRVQWDLAWSRLVF